MFYDPGPHQPPASATRAETAERPKTAKRSFKRLRKPLLLLLFCFGLLLIIEVIDQVCAPRGWQALRNGTMLAVRVAFITAWGVHILSRIPRDFLPLIAAEVASMLFWALMQFARTVITNDQVSIFVWYLYYIAMLGIPLALALVSRRSIITDAQDFNRRATVLSSVSLILLLMVLTNNIHEFVFRLDLTFFAGQMTFNGYTYGPGYLMVFAWVLYLIGSSMYMLGYRSKKKGVQLDPTMPLLVLGFALAYCVSYVFCIMVFGHDPGIFLVDAFSIMAVLFTEALVFSGFLPSDSRFGEMLASSPLDIGLFDESYEPLAMTPSMQQTPLPILQSQIQQGGSDTRAVRTCVRDAPFGYVMWREDVSVLNSLLDQLNGTKEALTEAGELISRESALKARTARVKTRSELYDRIALETNSQLEAIDDLLDDAVESPQYAYELLRKVCVMGSYVKRRSNLMIMAEGSDFLSSQELAYCLKETADALCACGIAMDYEVTGTETIAVAACMQAYDQVQSQVEASFDHMAACSVNACVLPECVILHVEIDGVKQTIVAGGEAYHA